MSSLTSFGSAGWEALQGHSKVFAILHRGAKRAILTRVTEGEKILFFAFFAFTQNKPALVAQCVKGLLPW